MAHTYKRLASCSARCSAGRKAFVGVCHTWGTCCRLMRFYMWYTTHLCVICACVLHDARLFRSRGFHTAHICVVLARAIRLTFVLFEYVPCDAWVIFMCVHTDVNDTSHMAHTKTTQTWVCIYLYAENNSGVVWRIRIYILTYKLTDQSFSTYEYVFFTTDYTTTHESFFMHKYMNRARAYQ